MEKIRHYEYADMRRANARLREVRTVAHQQKIGFAGTSASIQRRRDEVSALIDPMMSRHRDWVSVKFEPRIVALAGKPKNAAESDAIRASVKDHYDKGLSTAVLMHVRVDPDAFAAQDVIASYTGSFLAMLKVCERLHIPPGPALRLAQRSYSLDGQTLLRSIHDYGGRFSKSEITTTAVLHPSSFEERLAKLANQVVSLAVDSAYADIPLAVIESAVMENPRNAQKYLNSYKERRMPSEDTAQHVVFEAREHGSSQKNFVPIEVRKAGKALKSAMEMHGIEASAIAGTLGIAEADINAFINGELVVVNPLRVYHAATEWIDIEDTDMQEFYTQMEVLNWLQTVTAKKGLSRKKKLGRVVRLLRFANLETNPAFAKKLGVSHELLSTWENGTHPSDSESLGRVLKVSVLNNLGDNNKAIQYLFLLSAEENGFRKGDGEPMDLATLQKCNFGDLMRYLRQLRGATQYSLSEKFSYSRSQIEGFEREERVNSTFVEKLIGWLDLDQANSALADVLRHKAQETKDKKKKPIEQETLQKVLTEQYLFKEHIEELPSHQLSDSDKDLEPWLNEMKVGERVKFLRKRRRWRQEDLAQESGINKATIIAIERGKSLPKDISLLKVAGALGYDDIHNQIGLSLIDKLEEERAAA